MRLWTEVSADWFFREGRSRFLFSFFDFFGIFRRETFVDGRVVFLKIFHLFTALGRENECIFPSNVSIFFLQVCFLPWKTTGEQSNLSILWMEAIILSAKAAVAINAIGDSVHSYDHQWLRCGVDSCLR